MAKDTDLFEIHEARFDRMDKRVQIIEKQSNAMHSIITNGLVERVRMARKMSMWSVGLILVVLTSQAAILNLIIRAMAAP